MLFDGLILGGEFGLHHAGYGADAQGSAHQAGKDSVEGGVCEGEYVAGPIRARKQRPRSDSENGVFGVFMVFFGR